MRVDTANFAQRNVERTKRPRFTIEIAFNAANTVLRYLKSHADAATPPGAVVIAGKIEGLSGTSQTLNPDKATATIGNTSFRLVDKASAITAELKAQLVLGRSTRLQRTRVFMGYEGLAFADYALLPMTQLVTEITYHEGSYGFKCNDIQREMRKDIFELAKTNLSVTLAIDATTVTVASTTGFSMLRHSFGFSDAPDATVGYVKIEDEVIRYTGFGTPPVMTFTGCTRGALNTRAAEHKVDLTAAVERRTPVEEYVYLEMPATKLIPAILTGNVYSGLKAVSLPGETGDYVSTPDAAANSIVGDIDLRVRVRVTPADLTPAGLQTLCAKWGGAPSNSWIFRLTTGGFLEFAWSADGSTADTDTSTVTVAAQLGIPDGAPFWARVTEDVDNGAAGHDTKFYTSLNYNPLTGIGTWTQLGATVTTAGVMSIFASTAVVEIGSIIGGTQQLLIGRVNYAELRSGLASTAPAQAFDAERFAVGGLTATALTGEVWTVNQSGTPKAEIIDEIETTLPAKWHLGIPVQYVRLADSFNIGSDLWDRYDEGNGFPARFEDLDRTDGKKFIEMELCLLTGTFMPVYSDGALGLKRMANILAGSAYVAQLDERNLVGAGGELVHDFNAVHNILEVDWNWEPLRNGFTRHRLLIDANSINVYKQGSKLRLKFRGLHGSRHSNTMLDTLFDFLRDRYTGPPQRVQKQVMPSLNTLEVGDVVRLRDRHLRDYVSGDILDRSFEIQGCSIDWLRGSVNLNLFGSSRAPGPLAAIPGGPVLANALYSSEGVALSTVLTISANQVTANGTLTGQESLNNGSAIYYHLGDLTINAGVVVNWTKNVQLRIRGHLTINGTLTGKGAGHAGAAAISAPPTSSTHVNRGIAGAIGVTEAGGGFRGGRNDEAHAAGEGIATKADILVGNNPAVPSYALLYDGTKLYGLPDDLRGTSGSSGMPIFVQEGTQGVDGSLPEVVGGAGGAGGGGCIIICRGYSVGASGKLDVSGNDGVSGTPFVSAGRTYSGSGAGGSPGGVSMIADGQTSTIIGLDGASFVATQGKTLINGEPVDRVELVTVIGSNQSIHVGTGDGTTFPLPGSIDDGVDRNMAYRRVLYAPPFIGTAPDLGDPLFETLMQEFQTSNWFQRSNPKAFNLEGVVWADALKLWVAVGNPDGTDAYILTSLDGVAWTERANPKNVQLRGVAWNGTTLVAVGHEDGIDSYIITSSDAITWKERDPTVAKNIQLYDVTWSPELGLFVAVGQGDGTDSYILTSPTGTTWTERSNPKNMNLMSVAWSQHLKLFAAVGQGDGTDTYIVTSSDGLAWIERAPTVPKNIQMNRVVWFRDKFVAVGFDDGTDAYILTSLDGLAWLEQVNPRNIRLRGLVATSHLAFASGGIGSDAYSISSRDGINWRERENLRPTLYCNSMAWSGDRFIMVGLPDGTDALIATSLAR